MWSHVFVWHFPLVIYQIFLINNQLSLLNNQLFLLNNQYSMLQTNIEDFRNETRLENIQRDNKIRLENLQRDRDLYKLIQGRHHNPTVEQAVVLELATSSKSCVIDKNHQFSTEHAIMYREHLFTIGAKHCPCWELGDDKKELFRVPWY